MSIRHTIRAQFPNCKVSLVPGTYSYLHHDDHAFGRRTLSCIHVAISSKEYYFDRDRVRRLQPDPDPSAVVAKLRSAGLIAEINVNAPGCVSVITSGDQPVNVVYGLGVRNAR